MAMPVHARVHAVFGHFQNLNLLALLHDLASGRAVQGAWASGALLCPVAHGLPHRLDVTELAALGQAADLVLGCDRAARRLGADPAAVLRFVRSWDAESIGATWLLSQLEELWEERLQDAEAVQSLLQKEGSLPPERASRVPAAHEKAAPSPALPRRMSPRAASARGGDS
jgi:hypothetical protein